MFMFYRNSILGNLFFLLLFIYCVLINYLNWNSNKDVIRIYFFIF